VSSSLGYVLSTTYRPLETAKQRPKTHKPKIKQVILQAIRFMPIFRGVKPFMEVAVSDAINGAVRKQQRIADEDRPVIQAEWSAFRFLATRSDRRTLRTVLMQN